MKNKTRIFSLISAIAFTIYFVMNISSELSYITSISNISDVYGRVNMITLLVYTVFLYLDKNDNVLIILSGINALLPLLYPVFGISLSIYALLSNISLFVLIILCLKSKNYNNSSILIIFIVLASASEAVRGVSYIENVYSLIQEYSVVQKLNLNYFGELFKPVLNTILKVIHLTFMCLWLYGNYKNNGLETASVQQVESSANLENKSVGNVPEKPEEQNNNNSKEVGDASSLLNEEEKNVENADSSTNSINENNNENVNIKNVETKIEEKKKPKSKGKIAIFSIIGIIILAGLVVAGLYFKDNGILEPTIVTKPSSNYITYDGNEHALVSAGKVTGGKLLYSKSKDGNYSTTIPTATSEGTYTVYYKVVGDDFYKDIEPQKVSVTINTQYITFKWIGFELKSPWTLGSNTSSLLGLHYNGSSITISDSMYSTNLEYTVRKGASMGLLTLYSYNGYYYCRINESLDSGGYVYWLQNSNNFSYGTLLVSADSNDSVNRFIDLIK